MKAQSSLRFIPLLLSPLAVVAGAVLFPAKSHAWISLCVAVLACLPFFLRFEHRQVTAAELTCIAILTALTVAGRFLFAAIPAFKPVTALVILTGMYFGGEDGFLVGALGALVSNFYFGQGMWTPFQMLAWGVCGLLAGLLARSLKTHRLLLIPAGIVAGGLYSAIMDIWSVLFFGEGFSLTRYGAMILASLPSTVTYMVSNVVFLLILAQPLGRVLTRTRLRHGLDDPAAEKSSATT